MQQRVPMESIEATHPLELVYINYLCLEPGKEKEENILVVMDHFTRYAHAYITQSQMPRQKAKVLWDNFFHPLWVAREDLLDQGRNFESKLITNLWELTGSTKLRTSLYHPQTNDQCKRFNSTLINMLETLLVECKSNWKGSIRTLVDTYNCTCNSTMGFSPSFLMYCRQPWPPSMSPSEFPKANSHIHFQQIHSKAEGPY